MTQEPTFPHFSAHRRHDLDPLTMLREIPYRAVEAILTAQAPNPAARSERTKKPKHPAPSAPINLGVLDALRPDPDGIGATIHAEIAQAVRAVWEDHPHLDLPTPSLSGDCAWLITHAHLWQADEFLGEFVADAATTAHRALERLCNVEPAMRYRCPRLGCGARAHMQPGNRWLVCESGHTLDVEAERGRFLSMQDWTLTETASALRIYRGTETPLNTLKTWVKRGRIVPVDDRRPQRFNFAAVCRVVAESRPSTDRLNPKMSG